MKILELFDDYEDDGGDSESFDDLFGTSGPPTFLSDGWVRQNHYTKNGSIFGPGEIRRLLSKYPAFRDARLIPLGSGANGDILVSEIDKDTFTETSAGWVPLPSLPDATDSTLRSVYLRTHQNCFELFAEIQRDDDAPIDYYDALRRYGIEEE